MSLFEHIGLTGLRRQKLRYCKNHFAQVAFSRFELIFDFMQIAKIEGSVNVIGVNRYRLLEILQRRLYVASILCSPAGNV